MASSKSSSSPSKNANSNNAVMHQKCFEILARDTSDVNFICDNEAVRVPAHRNILASASPVFNAMFNGKLNEAGDVKIVDVSSAVFKEFLQLFYDSHVKLTMENVGGVMKLVDKYDVEHGWPICIDFLRNSILLEINNVLWGLYLAFQFGNDDLMNFCLDVIQMNIINVYKMIKLDENDTPILRSNVNHRPMSDANLACIFPLIQSINVSKTTATMGLDHKISNRFIPFTLTSGVFSSTNEVREMQMLKVKIPGSLHLSNICFSKAFKFNGRTKEYEPIECTVAIWIAKRTEKTYDTRDATGFDHFKLTANGENRFKLPDSLNSESIQDDRVYEIYMKIIPYTPPICTYGSHIPKVSTRMTPTKWIQITTEEPVSLISALHFEQK